MNQIKELPPGTTVTYCAHLEPWSLINGDTNVSYQIVILNEIPEEIGYHGACLECGSKYFSRPDGAF